MQRKNKSTSISRGLQKEGKLHTSNAKNKAKAENKAKNANTVKEVEEAIVIVEEPLPTT
jgi:hypothetical protein